MALCQPAFNQTEGFRSSGLSKSAQRQFFGPDHRRNPYIFILNYFLVMHDEDVFSRYSFTISGLSFLTWGSFAWESLFFFIAVTSGIINIVVVCTALIVPIN